MRSRILLLALSVALCAPVIQAEGARPPVLDRIEEPELLTILAMDSSGDRAVGAMPHGKDGDRSRIVFYSTERQAISVIVPAAVRALLLAQDDESVYALLHKSTKRGEGESYLARVDPTTGKSRRIVRLPPSAADIDHWPARGSLLIACRNELRTLRMPGMRSGPLYRIPGNNRAVASLASGDYVLVGQDGALLLVDLGAVHGEEEMPVAGRLPLPRPVNSISVAEDGSFAMITLDDDTVRTVNIGTLGTSGTIPPAAPDDIEVERPTTEAPPPEQEPVAVERVATTTAEEPETDPVKVAAEPLPVERADDEERPVQPFPEPEVATGSSAPAPAGKSGNAPAPQLRGTIKEHDPSAVVAVVILGPNNMLHEAARVVPGPDGSWSVSGLAAGKYRVQLDGGGRRVLVTDPPFLLIDVGAEGTAEADDIRLLKAL